MLPASIGKVMLAELCGTFLLVFLGCGAVHAAVLTGAQSGLWQVAVVWGIAIMIACYVTGGISGAHINPAMTIAFAVWHGFPWKKVPAYVFSQVAGAALGAAVLYVLFAPHLAERERQKGVVRGQAGSELTAMCYGEYFPNPGRLAAGDQKYSVAEHQQLRQLVPPVTALMAEFVGTMILAISVFGMTDIQNSGRPSAGQAPIFIGLTVSALISILAPLTQACFNPARDFGPRLIAYFAGWGTIAFPGTADLSWLTVYILAPVLGALTGGGIYQFVLRGRNNSAA